MILANKDDQRKDIDDKAADRADATPKVRNPRTKEKIEQTEEKKQNIFYASWTLQGIWRVTVVLCMGCLACLGGWLGCLAGCLACLDGWLGCLVHGFVRQKKWPKV